MNLHRTEVDQEPKQAIKRRASSILVLELLCVFLEICCFQAVSTTVSFTDFSDLFEANFSIPTNHPERRELWLLLLLLPIGDFFSRKIKQYK